MRCSTTAPGLSGSRVLVDPDSVAFRTRLTASAPGFGRLFAAQSHRLHTPCQRFSFPLTVLPHDSGSGWLRYLLSCMRLSLTTPRRFIPTLQARRLHYAFGLRQSPRCAFVVQRLSKPAPLPSAWLDKHGDVGWLRRRRHSPRAASTKVRPPS